MTAAEWFGGPDLEPIVLVDWDPGWAACFRAWERRLVDALGPAAVRVDHIGSTAVQGLVAKPVIDVLVGVPDVQDEGAYRPAIEALGLPLRLREAEHRYFRRPVRGPLDVHVHVCSAHSRWEREHLAFRDQLRTHPDVADRYAELKRRLAEDFGRDRRAYTEAKSAFIARVLADAALTPHPGA